jgi:hypothetical protein
MRLTSSLTKFVLSGLVMCVSSSHAQELKLEDAIQLALEHNRQLAIKKLEVAKAGEQISSLHTSLLPGVFLSGFVSAASPDRLHHRARPAGLLRLHGPDPIL